MAAKRINLISSNKQNKSHVKKEHDCQKVTQANFRTRETHRKNVPEDQKIINDKNVLYKGPDPNPGRVFSVEFHFTPVLLTDLRLKRGRTNLVMFLFLCLLYEIEFMLIST